MSDELVPLFSETRFRRCDHQKAHQTAKDLHIHDKYLLLFHDPAHVRLP